MAPKETAGTDILTNALWSFELIQEYLTGTTCGHIPIGGNRTCPTCEVYETAGRAAQVLRDALAKQKGGR